MGYWIPCHASERLFRAENIVAAKGISNQLSCMLEKKVRVHFRGQILISMLITHPGRNLRIVYVPANRGLMDPSRAEAVAVIQLNKPRLVQLLSLCCHPHTRFTQVSYSTVTLRDEL